MSGEEEEGALALLGIEELVVRFGGVTALDGPSFEVENGAICGLIGPNGAGKTTLFNCVSRLYTPQSGAIEFDGAGRARARAAPDRGARDRAHASRTSACSAR